VESPNRTILAGLLMVLVLILCAGAGFAGFWYGHHEGYVSGQSDGSTVSYKQGFGDGQQKGYTDAVTDVQRSSASQVVSSSVKKSPGSFAAHNPSYQEMKDFLAKDPTNSKVYVKEQYVCSDYASEVNNNAESQGIRSAVVELRYPNDFAHALVAFDTSDRGFIYVEPQFDTEVKVTIGQSYSSLNHFEKPEQDDTVLRILVMW
jgi:hypothetical protein